MNFGEGMIGKGECWSVLDIGDLVEAFAGSSLDFILSMNFTEIVRKALQTFDVRI
jgi:hypothetical protein